METRLPIIGRQAELERAYGAFQQAKDGKGRFVLVEGGVGMGKSVFVNALQEGALQIDALKNTQFASASCYAITGAQTAYQPFIEIIDELYRESRSHKEKTKKILAIVKEVGPDWLKLIPVLGNALSAGLKTASRIGEHLLGADDDASANLSNALAAQYVDMLVKMAAQSDLLCLIIRGAQWIDEVSCKLLLRLADHLDDQPIVVILSYRPSNIQSADPIFKVLHEIKMKRRPLVINMEGFSESEIDQYTRARFGHPLHPNLACWIHQLCRGRPLFVTQYFHLLEQSHIIERSNDTFILKGRIRKNGDRCTPDGLIADLPVPADVEEVIEQRIRRLNEEEQQMLEIGAVQGEQFISGVLAEIAKKDEINVLKQMRRVVDRKKVVHYYAGQDWIQTKSQAYAFEHKLTHQAFYERMGPAERAFFHTKIAVFLKNLLKDRRNLTRRLLIELARHYDLGGQPLEAAKYYYFAARAIFGAGAYGETIELCRKGLDNARRLGGREVIHDQLRVKLILLLLRASEMRWRGKPELQGRLPLDAFISEAEKAAKRTGDKSLWTQITFIKGVTYVSTRTLPEALSVLGQALKSARETKDHALEFSVLSFLGHQTASQNLEKGLKLQYQALEFYHHHLKGTAKAGKNRGLLRAYLRLRVYIGVAEFDRGNYGAAEKELNYCIRGFRQLRLNERLVEPLNYLGQLYIALGQFSKAEGLLKKAIAVFQNDPGNNPWRAYNKALLGKLYLEWQHVKEAAGPILQGWKETRATGNIWLVGLVKNYYTELLMHPDYRDRDLDEAEKLLSETIRETESSGFHRSGIWAASQMGQLQLLRQNTSSAVEHSTRAVQWFEKIGHMPALRAEEIYFNHYRVLKAAGQDDRARHFCLEAYNILRQKAASSPNAAYEKSLLNDVLLSRSIVSAFGAQTEAGQSV